MLLDMTIANFRSVKTPQAISFQAVKDNRLPESKVVAINEKLRVIKTAAVIGPNGAGKSTFVRALEALRAIITADEAVENPLLLLNGTSFAYSEQKGGPSQIRIQVVIDRGNPDNQEEFPTVIAQYTLVADRDKFFEETLYHIVGGSRKLMFERKLVDGSESELSYRYRWGKLYRGDKKRLVKKLSPRKSFLTEAARRGSETCTPLYSWIDESLLILPFGVSASSEKYLVEQLTAHPDWAQQLINFLWSNDITDIRQVRVQDGRVIFVHTNVTQHYASYFAQESLSLRRLSLIGLSFFESFISPRTVVIDDFGTLLHPDVLKHVVDAFESNNSKSGSQMLAVDCNPTLLTEGLLRRDGVWFAQKDSEGATTYYSLSDYRFSRTRDERRTIQQYLSGVYLALPITSEFYFVDSPSKEAGNEA